MTATALPFEDGQDTIRDLTTLNAKRMIALVRRVSRGELDAAAVIKARELILDVKGRQQKRQRAEREARARERGRAA